MPLPVDVPDNVAENGCIDHKHDQKRKVEPDELCEITIKEATSVSKHWFIKSTVGCKKIHSKSYETNEEWTTITDEEKVFDPLRVSLKVVRLTTAIQLIHILHTENCDPSERGEERKLFQLTEKSAKWFT